MELTKQIYEALAKMQTLEDLQAFMRVATIKGAASKSKFNIFNYVSSDDLRPRLCGVYHHELTNSEGEPYAGVAVASDARILVVSTQDYKDGLKGEIIRKDGTLVKDKTRQVVDGEDVLVTPKYPNYRSVISSAEKQNTNTAPIPEISKYYTQELAKFEVEYKEEQAQLPAKKRTKLTPFIAMTFGDATIWFNYHYLVKFITAAQHIGATELSYTPSVFESAFAGGKIEWRTFAILATGENPLDKVLIMPVVEYDEEGKHITEWANFAKYNDPNADL